MHNKEIKELYLRYLIKHQSEPLVMLDEMNLTVEQFKVKLLTDYAFNHMWGKNCYRSK